MEPQALSRFKELFYEGLNHYTLPSQIDGAQEQGARVVSDEASGGATRALAPPTAMIYMEPRLSPGYRREEEEEGKEGLEEEEEEASPGFVDSWLRRCVWSNIQNFSNKKKTE
jgi:hypothetical protein